MDGADVIARELERLGDRLRGRLGAGDDLIEADGDPALHDPGIPEDGVYLRAEALRLAERVQAIDGERVVDVGDDGPAAAR